MSFSPVTSDGIFLGEAKLHLKGANLDCTVPARFFHNYQKRQSVWAEVSASKFSMASSEVEVSSVGHLETFPGSFGGGTLAQDGGILTISAYLLPLQEPIQSSPVLGLKEVAFALLDSPLTADVISDQRPRTVTFPCGQFDVVITEPVDAHRQVGETLGRDPHRLSNSGTIRERNGQLFSSKTAQLALDTVHDALSFAAGRWAGITLVEGRDVHGDVTWFRWGTSRMTRTSVHHSWYDPWHTEWITTLCDGFLNLKSNEEKWESVRTAMYWYMRSNTLEAGVDGSLILSQCALELLSWFVIVKRTGALREEGYGQLSSASEKLGLALTLLGIPRQIPSGLTKLVPFAEKKDVAEVLVAARNYLVHPTQSRSGKRNVKRDYPWYELWMASQWLLELVILRLLGYTGSYSNRTRLRKFQPIEQVPWK
jgi:hypothetical protein